MRKPNESEKPLRKRQHSEQRRADLVRIAYGLIASNGLEGFRTRQIAEAAGIDTGTLHYHFPSKEAIIQGVVNHLVTDFQINRVATHSKPANALEWLRNEIHDVALRVQQSPKQFRVLIDLRVHALRQPAIATILEKQDRVFHSLLVSLLSQGINEKVFRPDIDLDLTAAVLKTQLIGLSFMALQKPARTDKLAAMLCSQIESWLGLHPVSK